MYRFTGLFGAAAALDCEAAAAVFEPHPRRYFQPEAPPFRLQTPAQRSVQLQGLGASQVYEICFDAGLAAMSDEDFARDILAGELNAAHVCVGADFRFGRGRMGDSEGLTRLGQALGFSVTAVAPVTHAGERYSSTAIRAALALGDVAKAATMLGRYWAVEGVIVTGAARGRQLGMPTANLDLGEYQRPRLGAYAVRVWIEGEPHDGVASIGVNPTFGALPAPVLEAHIFDFDGDLYGRWVEIDLIAFLRDEAAFDDVEALKAQMLVDAQAAKAALLKAPR